MSLDKVCNQKIKNLEEENAIYNTDRLRKFIQLEEQDEEIKKLKTRNEDLMKINATLNNKVAKLNKVINKLNWR